MIRESPAARRDFRQERLTADLAIAGGGLAGTCAAITAARAGLRVVLAQDRPVLGGNASSEIRLWILGATSHMGNNNRWAREGGVIDEILIENLHRNPEGNPVLVDPLLLEKASEEPNIALLLNTAVHDVAKSGDAITALRAFCPQNQTEYTIEAPLYCDASGDGVVGLLSGAAFRMGAEGRAEFNEGFAPEEESSELLGHSLYFHTRDTGRPVCFTAPSFALKDITRIPRWRTFRSSDQGCWLWWLEWGGGLDTVHDTERIKWELWRVVYGVWDHIKNSGRFPEAKNLTLEWVGMLPGKRESRRFEGDFILTQQDIVEQRAHPDDVAFGGWAMDLHPPEGLYSEKDPCIQWHSKGVYPIPYRCLYSRNVENLFLAGRIISASHVAFGSTRVMATCAHGGQAVGMAAAVCRRRGVRPAGLNEPALMRELQRELLRSGQHIPGVRLEDPADLARQAAVTASSRIRLERLEAGEETVPLDAALAMLLPAASGPAPAVTFLVNAAEETEMAVLLRIASRPGNFTPDITLERRCIRVDRGARRRTRFEFSAGIPQAQYIFVCLEPNPALSVYLSDERLTGVLSATHALNAAVAKAATQRPPEGSGIDTFEFWLPKRRPGGKNLAIEIAPPLDAYRPENVVNGIARPTLGTNAWVAAPDDPAPSLTLCWDAPQTIARVELSFDTDFDHPMESVLIGHPERAMPFTVMSYRLRDGSGAILAERTGNYQTRNSVRLPAPVRTSALTFEVLETHGAPAALFEIRCYAE